MSAFQPPAKEQLELLIFDLVNKWLPLKMGKHNFNPKIIHREAEKFLNLSLRTVYGMASKGVFSEKEELRQYSLEKEELLNYLNGGTELTFAEIQKLSDDHKPCVVKIISEKTSMKLWMQEIPTAQRMGVRLKNVLKTNSKSLNYLEDITQKNFLDCRNAGAKTWAEFVKLRGY
jgi:hypothetical protein